MGFKGKDRRIHTCFVTANREYHVRSGVVMAVRDIKSKVWIAGHRAIGMRLRPLPRGVAYIGRKLEFYCMQKKELLQTTPVVDIVRPVLNVVDSYGFVRGFLPPKDQDLVG